MKIHEKYLRRCLQIGTNALGLAAPNPMVGAIIVNGDTIIGEGFTSIFGGPHAEVNALNAVQQPAMLKNTTLYVSLEPCCHHGKTPPCTDAIIGSGISRVVIGIRDPNPKVAGMGISKLKAAGIEVIVDILEEECREHHRRFLTVQEKHRPYIILKWAQSQDGFLAPEDNQRKQAPEPYWITGNLARQLVHKWRTEEMGILVGTQTAVDDDPALTARAWQGKSPYRLVIDRNLRIPRDSKLLDQSTPTAVFHQQQQAPESIENLTYVPLENQNDIPGQICDWAYEKGLSSIIVEGGAQTLSLFISDGLWDEARIFHGITKFYKGISAPEIRGKNILEQRVDKDRLQILRND